MKIKHNRGLVVFLNLVDPVQCRTPTENTIAHEAPVKQRPEKSRMCQTSGKVLEMRSLHEMRIQSEITRHSSIYSHTIGPPKGTPG